MCPVWIGWKVKDVDLKRLGRSKLGSRRTYAIYHLLFSPPGNLIHMDLMMVKFRQIGAPCPVDVEAHSIGLGPFYKALPTEGCLQCRGVFDGLLKVHAEVSLRTRFVPGRRDLPICVFE